MFRATAHVLHLTGFLGQLLKGSSGSFRLKQTMCKSVKTRFPLPFYFCLFCFLRGIASKDRAKLEIGPEMKMLKLCQNKAHHMSDSLT